MDIFVVLLLSTINIIWTLPLVLLLCFNIRLFQIDSMSIINEFDSLQFFSTIIKNDKPYGFLIGKNFIGYKYIKVIDKLKNDELWILMNLNSFKKINKKNENDEKGFNFYERFGCFFEINYKSRWIPYDIEPNENQKEAIDKIMDIYNKKNLVQFYYMENPILKNRPLLLF